MKEYSLEKVQEITWIDKELIRKAARMYATTKPAAIQWGVPTEETNNCTDFTRTAIGLMGITGNLDAPGGNALFVNPPTRTVAEFGRHKDLSKEVLAKRLGGEQFKLGARVAFINPKKAWDSIVYGEPYQLKAGLLCGTNPVVTRANAREAYEALKKNWISGGDRSFHDPPLLNWQIFFYRPVPGWNKTMWLITGNATAMRSPGRSVAKLVRHGRITRSFRSLVNEWDRNGGPQ